MTKTNVLLIFVLVLVSVIADRIAKHASTMAAWSSGISKQAPNPDPRRVATTLDARIVTVQRKIQQQVLILRHMIPVSDLPTPLEAKNVQAAGGTSKVLNAARLRTIAGRDARYLLSNPLDKDEIRSVAGQLDSKQVALPKSVRVYKDALDDWIQLRSQWPEPIGRYELDSIIRYGRYSPTVISALDPNVAYHRQIVERALQNNILDARVVIDWLNRRKPLNVAGDEITQTHSYTTLLSELERAHATRDPDAIESMNQQVVNWMNTHRGEQIMGAEVLSLTSHLNQLELWVRVESQLSNRRTTADVLARIAAHGLWHAQRIDDSSLPILEKLRLNPDLPVDAAGFNPAAAASAQDLESNDVIAATKTLDETVESWISEVQFADWPRQETLYRRLLSVTPNDRLREQVLGLTQSFMPTNDTSQVLADALWCRWATSKNAALLYQHATVSDRMLTSLDDPDATAEAIKTICLQECDCAEDAARFWLQQSRWPRTISDAWSEGGPAAELALCEALLATDPRSPPSGIQASLKVLSGFGGQKSFAAIEALKREADKETDNTFGLNRFLDFAISRIKRRLKAEGTD